jgi:hypothetical protein
MKIVSDSIRTDGKKLGNVFIFTRYVCKVILLKYEHALLFPIVQAIADDGE